MIGSSAQIHHDIFTTPMTVAAEMPGPVIHLHAVAAAIDGEFLRATGLRTGYGLVGAGGLLALLLAGLLRRPAIAVTLLLGLSIAYLAAARLLYDYAGLLLLTVPVLAAFLLSGAVVDGL